MPLPQHLQRKLQQLREEYKSDDSADFIDNIEQELSTLVTARENLALPAFRALATRALAKTNELNALLSSDTTLLNEKGRIISNERDMWRVLLTSFGMDEVDTTIQYFEDMIEQKLPVADPNDFDPTEKPESSDADYI